MNIGKNFNEIRESFSSDEKMIESAFKLERIYKKYKVFLWVLIVGVILAISAYFINEYYKEQYAIKYTKIYNDLLKEPNNDLLKEKLKNGNKALYNIFLFKEAISKDNIADLNEVSNSDDFVSYVASYTIGTFDRNVDELAKIDKFSLGSYANLQRAYLLVQSNEFDLAKEVLDKIPLDNITPETQLIRDVANMLSSYIMIQKELK